MRRRPATRSQAPTARTEFRRATRRTERGAAVPIAVMVVLLAAGLGIGVARVGQAATGRARADAIADVVALAAVTAGGEGASEVAQRNGARLVEQRSIAAGAATGSTSDPIVVVTIEASGVRSTAAARAAR